MGFISMHHIPSRFNVSDTLSKHWGHQSNYENLIKPILNFHDYEKTQVFTEEELALLLGDDDVEVRLNI